MKGLLLAVLMMGCATVTSARNDVMDKAECENRCIALGYEIREVRDGNCICNLSKFT